MDMSRRELVTLGAVGVGGAIVGRAVTSETPASAGEPMGGIHISVLTRFVSPDAVKGFPHHFTMTVYGPDHALDGMGWGGAFDLETQEEVINSQMTQCIYSVRGVVQGEIVKLDGIMLFSADRMAQGQALAFEANLATGFVRATAPIPPVALEGKGVVARI